MKKYSNLVVIAASVLLAGALLISGCGKDDETLPVTLLNVDSEGNTIINNTLLAQQVTSLATEPLSQDERESILFVREEEKLARDANTIFYQKWAQLIFNNISNAEQTHMDAVLLLINKYSLTDPVGSNATGVFNNSELQTLYNTLTAQGNISFIEALKAGVAIEEIDIMDLNSLLADSDINNQDIRLVYSNLLKGSRNHLRSFVKVLQRQGVTYVPQYLAQAEYNSIINSPMETGN
jgi:hypothetical protein